MSPGDRVFLPNTKLLEARLERHWSQRELAGRLGTTFVNVSRWERGITVPGVYYRRLLCQMFEKPAAELGLLQTSPAGTQRNSTPVDQQAPPEAPAHPTTLWHLPAQRNPFFTGRAALLAHLHQLLRPEPAAPTRSVLLSGMGGLGKTQTAFEYAYRSAGEYRAILWLPAESAERLLAGFLTLATLLQLPERQERDQQRVVAAVSSWLSTHEDWLLIFDNVEDVALVKGVLPPTPHGSLLFTSRQQTLDISAHRLSLETLSPEESVTLLRRRARLPELPAGHGSDAGGSEDEEALCAIARTLDGLPLALDQAGSYLDATRCRPADYLHLLRTALLPLLNERESSAEHPLSVVQTVQLARAQLEREHPEADEILAACAYLAPAAIPELFFLQGAGALGPTFEQFAADPLRFHQAMKALLAYSFIQRDRESRSITVHRLVQAILRAQQPAALQKLWRARVLAAMSQVLPGSAALGSESWEGWERLLPHALTCVALWEDAADEPGTLQHSSWMAAVGDYLTQRARYAEAGALFQRMLNRMEACLGPDHALLAFPLHGLGTVALEQGQYAAAEPLLQRAIRLREGEPAVADPLLTVSLTSLALLYWQQGAFEKARPLYMRVLQIKEALLGPEHAELVLPLTGLAVLSWQQGEPEAAEQLYLRAVKLMDPSQPATAHTLHGLADLYRQQGKYEQAEPLFQQALQMQERHLGTEHPHVARLLTNLAFLYADQGKYEAAEALYHRALHIQETALGPAHPDTSYTLQGLADLYRVRCDYAAAEPLYRRVYHLLAHSIGVEQPRTAYPLYGLALLYQSQGNNMQARDFFEQALAIRLRALGAVHPETEQVRAALARLTERQQRTM